jgi:exopolysaccharide production protein ExoY
VFEHSKTYKLKFSSLPFTQPEVANSDLSKGVTWRLYRKVGKRMLDILLVLISLPFTLPLILVLAALAMTYNKSPFFRHRRIGKSGREFYCWKIRSMISDAESHLRLHLENDPKARAEWERNFKLEDDPRITRLGGFFRRSSLDELPQMWNILIGDMGFVGPRPVTAVELDRYGSHVAEYKMIRPGLTGLWQVSGRNDTSYEERVLMDVDYVHCCSPALDASIMFRTVMVVVGRTGK